MYQRSEFFVHNPFAFVFSSVMVMFESSTLFWMILGILVLIAACLLLIAYEISKKDLGRKCAHTKKRSEALNECAFYFGFLSEQPDGIPIPDECFGCTLALSCIKATKQPTEDQVEKPIPAS
jgi:hypothetical protein